MKYHKRGSFTHYDWLSRKALRNGGERGIRTLDTGFGPYNGLANRRLQPLGHLSGVGFQQSNTLSEAMAQLVTGGLEEVAKFFARSNHTESLRGKRCVGSVDQYCPSPSLRDIDHDPFNIIKPISFRPRAANQFWISHFPLVRRG